MDKNDFSFNGEEIKLDKIRHLRLGIKGLKLLSKKFGSVEKAFKQFDKSNDMDEDFLDILVAFLHACLVHEEQDITIEEVENLIDFPMITETFKKIANTLKGSMPQKNEVETSTAGESQLTSTESNTTAE